MTSYRGQLILIEGLDRSGKSTQASILHEAIPNSKLVKFPDRTTSIGKIIDNYLTDSNFDLSDQSAHLLFSANRWELADQIIEDLNNGKFVIMDRYIYSGMAYSLAKSEFFGEHNSPEMSDVNWLYSPDKGLPKPDLTIFLTLDLDEISSRKGWGEERYEKQEFQKIVKKCFLRVIDFENDKSTATVDVNNKDIDHVSKLIWSLIRDRRTNELTNEPIEIFI